MRGLRGRLARALGRGVVEHLSDRTVSNSVKAEFVLHFAFIERFRTVQVINTKTNTVIDSIPVGNSAFSVAVTPNGKKVYVTNQDSNTISVIALSTLKVGRPIKVGKGPVAIGNLIQ